MTDRPPSPLQVIAAMRWLGELTPDEIVDAIRRGADDVDTRYPDLTAEERDRMKHLAHAMTKSRLRAWKGGEAYRAAPTWLHVRALIAGLYATLD